MEQNTDRMYWTIGVIVLGSLLLLGCIGIFGDTLFPQMSDSIHQIINGDPSTDTDKDALADDTEYNISVSGVTTYTQGKNLYNTSNNDPVQISSLNKKDGKYVGEYDIDLSRYTNNSSTVTWQGMQVTSLFANITLTEAQKANISPDFLAQTNNGAKVPLLTNDGSTTVNLSSANPSLMTRANIIMKDGTKRVINVTIGTKNSLFDNNGKLNKGALFKGTLRLKHINQTTGVSDKTLIEVPLNLNVVDIVNAGTMANIELPVSIPLDDVNYFRTHPNEYVVESSNITMTLNDKLDYYRLNYYTSTPYNDSGVYNVTIATTTVNNNSKTNDINVSSPLITTGSLRINYNIYSAQRPGLK